MSGPLRKISDAERARVVKLLADGIAVSIIAERFGIRPVSIYRIRDLAAGKPDPHKPNGRGKNWRKGAVSPS